MPSENKTAVLKLNRWSGTDKPKKDDFNYDNLIIDSAVGEIKESIEQLKNDSGGNSGGGEKLGEIEKALGEHMQDSTLHISEEEREKWNSGGGSGAPIFGSYIGNGNMMRKIFTEKEPVFGFVFAQDEKLIAADFIVDRIMHYSGVFGKLGCSDGLEASADGFTVYHYTSVGPDGSQIWLNFKDKKYNYVYWA